MSTSSRRSTVTFAPEVEEEEKRRQKSKSTSSNNTTRTGNLQQYDSVMEEIKASSQTTSIGPSPPLSILPPRRRRPKHEIDYESLSSAEELFESDTEALNYVRKKLAEQKLDPQTKRRKRAAVEEHDSAAHMIARTMVIAVAGLSFVGLIHVVRFCYRWIAGKI